MTISQNWAIIFLCLRGYPLSRRKARSVRGIEKEGKMISKAIVTKQIKIMRNLVALEAHYLPDGGSLVFFPVE